MFGLLPPSSSEIFFTLARGEPHDLLAGGRLAGERDLADPGCAAIDAPAVPPGPVTTLRTPAGMPASSASSPRRIAVSGVYDAGFRIAVLPAASAGATFQAAISSGKFHGTISPDHADRLAQRQVDTGLGDRDRLAVDLVRGAGVVVEHEAGADDLAACRR